MRRFGILSLALTAAALTGCVRYGFAGGGLPSHIRTMAVLPFENETASPELQRELFELLRRELRSRLGVREGAEATADALVRGTIKTYDVDIPVGFSADPQQAVTARRKLQITVDIAIVDQSNGRILWERRGLRAEGEYAERAEAAGRRAALEKLVNDVVEGAQSQW
jgi:hypothetical protein